MAFQPKTLDPKELTMSPSQEKRLTNGKISSVPRCHREIKLEAALAVLGSLLVLAFAAVPAMAETPATICMPYSATTGQLDAGKPIIAGNEEGTCKNTRKITYHPLGLPGPSGLETLSKVLPHMNYEAEGVGGKPTIAFSGLNVQIDSGAGQENVINGEGNLVIGYNPPSTGGHTYQECVVYPAVSGSNNLILGEKNGADGYGSIVTGYCDNATGNADAVLGGVVNEARGSFAAQLAGELNYAGAASVTLGGSESSASEGGAVLNGHGNAANSQATVVGGYVNTASERAVIGGGYLNTAAAESFLGGGGENKTKGKSSSLLGGHQAETTKEFETKL